MNIYDKLNELNIAIKESNEYIAYENAAKEIDKNETYSTMVKDFLTAQIQLTTVQMLGQTPSQDQIDNFNSIYANISNISVINDFLQAQVAFSRIMDDVTKELTKTATLDVNFLNFKPDDK